MKSVWASESFFAWHTTNHKSNHILCVNSPVSGSISMLQIIGCWILGDFTCRKSELTWQWCPIRAIKDVYLVSAQGIHPVSVINICRVSVVGIHHVPIRAICYVSVPVIHPVSVTRVCLVSVMYLSWASITHPSESSLIYMMPVFGRKSAGLAEAKWRFALCPPWPLHGARCRVEAAPQTLDGVMDSGEPPAGVLIHHSPPPLHHTAPLPLPSIPFLITLETSRWLSMALQAHGWERLLIDRW